MEYFIIYKGDEGESDEIQTFSSMEEARAVIKATFRNVDPCVHISVKNFCE